MSISAKSHDKDIGLMNEVFDDPINLLILRTIYKSSNAVTKRAINKVVAFSILIRVFEGKDGVKFMRNADAVNKLGSYIIIKHYGWVIKDLKDRLSGLANRGLISIEDGQLKPRLSGNDASKLLEEIDSRLRRLLGDAAEEIIKSHDKALYIMNAEGVARLIQIMERRGIRIEDIKSSDIIKGVSMKDFIEIINKLKRECTVCLDSKELENEARNYNEIEEL